MKLATKSLQRNEWLRVTKKEFKCFSVKKEEFDGVVGFLKIIDLKSPLYIDYPYGKVKIADKNYKWLQFAPRNKNWWLTVMYDDEDNIVESYFDITKENNFENEVDPFFVDMKLDVVIPVRNKPIILDTEEIKEALSLNLISQDEYDLAFCVADKIIKFYSEHTDYYYNELETMKKMFE